MGVETDYQRVRRMLEEQFQAAVKRRDLTSGCLTEVSRSIPSGLPRPDGTQRISNASSDYKAALNEVSCAVQRIADFQIRGIIPDDLKKHTGGGDSAASSA
jgi:hypothetical protein